MDVFILENIFYNMNIFNQPGVTKIDAETELQDANCFVKGVYIDREKEEVRVDVVYYEINYRHMRTYNIDMGINDVGNESFDIKELVKTDGIVTGFKF